MLESLYYYLGYEEKEVQPCEKTIKARHEMLKQIRLSKLKLNNVITEKKPKQVKPVNFKRRKKRRKSNN